MATNDGPEAFPSLSPANTAEASAAGLSNSPAQRLRRTSTSSSIGQNARARGSSLLQSFINSNPPLGMWQATGEVAARFPTLPEIKNGAFDPEGWNHEGQMEQRGSNPHEIHRRRLARTSSASNRTRGSTLSAATPAAIPEERASYFPTREPVAEEATTPPVAGPPTGPSDAFNDVTEKPAETAEATEKVRSSSSMTDDAFVGPDETGTYPNGYRFPKKHTWTQSVVIGSKAFWKFACTPFGFVITIYGLNVVAWGAMIFFVLLNAAPAMCHPSCDDLRSARKKWIEYDSQILNGLFCVTGFGLAPWRFRDFYFLFRWRVLKDYTYFRKLAGVNRGWFRLPGSNHLPDDMGPPPVYTKKNPQLPESPPPYTEQEIAAMEANPAVPLPPTSMAEPPLTGVRASPTRPVLIDVVVLMYFMNTVFQVILAFFMWHFNRFTRPSWGTGLFISIGCVVAIVAGVVSFVEGSKVKKVEGIPVHEYDVFETVEEAQERKRKHDEKHHRHHKNETGTSNENGGSGDVTPEIKESRKVKGKHWFVRH